MKEETTPSSKLLGASMRKHLLPIFPLLLAGGVIVLALHSQIERVRKSTEQETLAPIAAMFGIRDNISRDEIYQYLTFSMQDREVIRKARIAEHCGMEPDWNQIFDRIETLEEPDRNEMLQRIATDYSFPRDMSLQVMKRLLIQRTAKLSAMPKAIQLTEPPIAVPN